MKTFMVTTQSVFSNKYFIVAETEEEAVELAIYDYEQTYYQLHLGEQNTIVEEVEDYDATLKEIKKAGYF